LDEAQEATERENSDPGGLDLSCIQQAVKQRKEVTFSPPPIFSTASNFRFSEEKHFADVDDISIDRVSSVDQSTLGG
jgi:hypothetical protein